MRRTVPPSAEIEEQIDGLLAVGVGENPRESLSELARLGARLIIQRAVEDEFDAWLGRARYERRPDYLVGRPRGIVCLVEDPSPMLDGSRTSTGPSAWRTVTGAAVLRGVESADRGDPCHATA